MKQALKYIGFIILILIALFFFVVNFSAARTSYQCTGELTENGTAQPTTVFITIEEYRPWVGLWSDSDGSMKLEIPNVIHKYYPRVERVGEQRQIYQEGLVGNFSTLSKTLALDIEFFGFFDGNCQSVDK